MRIVTPALSVLTALYLALVVPVAVAQTEPTKPALTKEQQTEAGRAGALLGRDEHYKQSNTTPSYTAGGETGAGVFKVDGRNIDGNKLVPGADKTRADGLNDLYENGQNFDKLKEKTAARDLELQTDDGPAGKAHRVGEVSAIRSREEEAKLKEDKAFWDRNLGIQQGAENGGIPGGPAPPKCTTTTTTTTTPGTAYIEEEKTCERIPDFGKDALCTREVVEVGGTTNYDQEQRALLAIDAGTTGQICRRERFVTSHRDTLSQSRAGDLDITNETAGLSCKRYRWATEVITPQDVTKTGSLAINTEIGGVSCRRERWVDAAPYTINGSRQATLDIDNQTGGLSCTRYINVTNATGSQAGSINTVLSINNEAGGLVCNRSRAATTNSTVTSTGTIAAPIYQGSTGPDSVSIESFSIAHLVPAGTTAISNLRVQISTTSLWVDYDGIVEEPTAANGWVMKYRIQYWHCDEPYASDCVKYGGRLKFSFLWDNVAGTTTWSVIENGNCATPGSPSCPLQWSCITEAPATVNGSYMAAADVSGLPQLFPGSTATCLSGNLSKVCGGNADTSNTVSIAHLLPAGTTSISGFKVNINNPQVGVTVTATQVPSLANGWVAILQVRRSDWAYNPVNPNVTLTWTSSYGTTSHSIVETGNCGDTGTVSCPATWVCDIHAPGTVAGVLVSTDIAAARAPLYPGAASTCAQANLSRLCSGSVARSTNVSIADLIPAGVTVISNFGFTVQNPQSGVSVTLVAAPTLANNWVAQFSVIKTNFTTTTSPIVNLTWQVNQTNYTWSVRDSGGSFAQLFSLPPAMSPVTSAALSAMSMMPTLQVATATTTDCSDPGSSVCPTAWSCTASAPTTINGVNVSAGMVSGLAQLFPGAASTCTAGQLSRVCSGASSLGTSISVADQIPAGVTTIRNLAFTVVNPQAGVTVQMVSPPTYANGWMAGFQVTRTNYSYQPVPVQVRITFTVDVSSIALSVQEQGNCADPGSTACPTAWTCVGSAPTTINGLSITAAMVQGAPLLYPGASNLCVSGELKRVCNGQSAISTQIPIGDLLPEGTTEITNFAWRVTNPQTAISVSLVSAPSLANGWVATFNVVRNYAAGGTPTKPNIMMTWNVLGPVQYDHSVITQGDCSGAADGAVSPSCSVRWRCLTPLPKTFGDLTLTKAMLSGRMDLELYPGEGLNCADAVRERTCVGDGSNLTVVDISDKIPPTVTVLNNYGWDVTTASPGVVVEQVSPPTLANGWKATFRTRRTDWSVTPNQPEVRLHWQITVATTGTQVNETGDCSQTGDAYCKADWRCVEEFPATDDGTLISSESMSVSFGPPINSGGVATYRSFSIGNLVPAGTKSIRNFQMQLVKENVDSSIQGITQKPSADNGWMVTIQDDGNCEKNLTSDCIKFNGGLNVIKFTWDNMSGEGSTQTQDPPIYPGASPTCKRAEKYLNCETINDGEVCHETEQGTVCDTVEGGPFDNCKALAEDPNCTKKRTLCNEDGWGGTTANPICRIETDVYVCRTKVGGDDVIVKENTTCSGEMSACLDGSCTENVETEEVTDSATLRRAAAQLVIRENMRSDYKSTGYAPTAAVSRAQNNVRLAAAAGQIADKLFGGVVAEARAQAIDPWKMPSGAEPDSTTPGTMPNYTMDTMRFFDGKSYNCMKALGGLLNCCTKNIDPKATNTEWWKSFGDTLKKKYAQSQACDIESKPDEEKESGADEMTAGASFDSLSKAFTGARDRLQGGGTMPTCGQPPKMEDVMNDFMGTMKSKYFPKLAWYCDTDEKELAAQKEVGNCSYLGDYCRSKVLGFCVDKRQRHCCFNSPMTKMIREQLRDKGVKGMGTAKNPDCGGVSPAQFAAMNTEELDTNDLEGRMLMSGQIPDLANLANGAGLLEQWTGTGSAINSDRVNAHKRTNDQLAATNPSGANDSIDNILKQSTPTAPTPTTASAGTVSFKVGFRTVNGPVPTATQKLLKVSLIRTGGAGAVSVRVGAASLSAMAGTDFTFAAKTVSWASGDTTEKTVDVVLLRNASRTAPGQFELRLSSPTGGVTITPTARMQITINP